MLAVLALIVLMVRQALGQATFVIAEQNIGIGGCAYSSDCAIYAQIIPSLNLSTVFCNALIGRCQTFSGTVLSPAFDAVCPTIQLNYVVFPSLRGATAPDGLLIIEITVPTANLSGVLRVYSTNNTNGFNYTNTSYLAEQYVNYPDVQYYFRNLAWGVYTVEYFHFTGCHVLMADRPVVANANDGTYMPAMGFTGADTDYVTLAGVNTTTHHTRRAVRQSLQSPWNINTHIHDAFVDANHGQRIPFGHVYGMQGDILDTVIGRGLFNTANATFYGATFPVRAPPLLFTSIFEATYLAGVASVQLGIGYVYTACANCSAFYLRDEKGMMEGYMAAPQVLDLSNPQFLPDPIPPYSVTPMNWRLNGIMSNTQFEYLNNSLLNGDSPPLNLSVDPKITVTDPDLPLGEPFNGICGPIALVTLDYSEFTIFTLTAVYLSLRMVQRDNSTGQLELFALQPDDKELIVAAVWQLEVYEPGFYCAILAQNFLDYTGYRTIIQSCFQVGMPATGLTQVSSVYSTEGVQRPYTSYDAYAGPTVAIITRFIASLPVTLVLRPTQDFTVTLHGVMAPLFAVNNSLTQFAGTFDADYATSNNPVEYEIFNDFISELDTASYYDTLPFAAPHYVVYVLNRNMAVRNQLVVTQSGHDSVQIQNEVYMVRLYVYNTSKYPLYEVTTVPQFPPVVNYTLIPTNQSFDYICNTPTVIASLQSTTVKNYIEVQNAICPNDASKMIAHAWDGIPYHECTILNEACTMAQNALTYKHIWINVDPTSDGYGTTLLQGLDQTILPAPSDILVQLVTRDERGSYAVARARSQTLITAQSTRIVFLPQQPVCTQNGTNSTQGVMIAYSVFNDLPGSIQYWLPLDSTTINNEEYNPNVIQSDIPSDCVLVGTMTDFAIYQYCFVQNDPDPACNGCRHLPPRYAKAAGNTLITIVRDELWQVVIWVPSGTFNANTNRSYYCRFGNDTEPLIPLPLTATFSQLARLPSCFGSNCFTTTITPVVDPRFASFGSGLVILVSPGSLVFSGVGAQTFVVDVRLEYNITLLAPGIFCQQQLALQKTLVGPVITLIRTTPATCSIADSIVFAYVRYNNPSVSPSIVGTDAKVCFYFPLRRGPGFESADEVPFEFVLPIDGTVPTLTPYMAAFGFDNGFQDVTAGPHQIMIYDRCAGGDCLSCRFANTFQLTDSALNFAFQTFQVENFANSGGRIEIVRNGYQPARCNGDCYSFNYTVLDDVLRLNDYYQVSFVEAVSNEVIFNGGSCLDFSVAQIQATQMYGSFQVLVGADGFFSFDFCTSARGLGFSGNYTLVVRNCNTGCVKTFPTYIDFVQPMLITLSSPGTTCAYKLAPLVPSVIGGTPFQRGQNVSLLYEFPDSSITFEMAYLVYVKTPLNPNNFVQTNLPIDVLPGFYVFRFVDANNCSAEANVTVSSYPPIVITQLTVYPHYVDGNGTRYSANVSGGDGGPYFMLEDVTALSAGTVISGTFVGSFNETLLVHIMDSSGCINPVAVSLTAGNPGPLVINVTHTDSCQATPTGVIHVTSTQLITCTWQAAGVNIPVLQTCTLAQVPYNSFLVVIARTTDGRTATAEVDVLQKPPVTITQLSRTTAGLLGGDCVDNITLALGGGTLAGPPYAVALVHDLTGAVLSVVGNGSLVLITQVCRSYVYTISAANADTSCPSFYVSSDSQFVFGSGTPQGIPGLPVLNAKFAPFIACKPAIPDKPEPFNLFKVLMILLGMFLVAIFVLFLFFLQFRGF